MKFLILFLIFPCFLFSFDKVIHLHLDNLNSFYKNAENNKILKSVYKSSGWTSFKNSKLFIRLSNNANKVDPNGKLLSLKTVKKIPGGSLDFYLTNIEEQYFVAKLKLDKAQSAALLNIDFEKSSKIVFLEKTIISYQKLSIVLEDDNLYISNKLEHLKNYFKDLKSMKTLNKKEGFRNFISIDMESVNKTPYLKNYWFNNLKNFSNITNAEIHFNIDKKSFVEEGLLSLKNSSEKAIEEREKVNTIDNKFKIKLFNKEGSFQIAPFVKEKNIKIYSMVSNDFKSNIYLATYTGKDDFIAFLKKINASAKIVTGDIIKYSYGLMNKKTVYIKLIKSSVLLSENMEDLNKIKLKEETSILKEISITDFTNISKQISSLSKLNKNNYSYNDFLKSFLNNYTKIKSFNFQLKHKDNNKLEFKTKILF